MKNNFQNLKSPIFVALDVDTEIEAITIAEKTHKDVGGYKIGPRLVFNCGAQIIRRIEEYAPVFLDFKFLDIPSTMDAAVRSAFEAGSTFVTVHATSGPEALRLLAQTEKELSQRRPFNILAVTLLTSFSEDTLPANYKEESIVEQIILLVNQCVECGIKSFVCSPHELKILKQKFPDCYFVTPGIRLKKELDDQKRTSTPAEAIQDGASALVIGRPILKAEDPTQFLKEILQTLKKQ